MYNLGRYSALRVPRSIHTFSPTTRLELHTTTTTSAPQTNRRHGRKSLLGVSVILFLGAGAGGVWIANRNDGWIKLSPKKIRIDPTIFHPFELISKENVSSTCSIFTLKSYNNPYRNLYREIWSKGAVVWSVQIKQPQLQIARSYTPLPPPLPLDLSEGCSEIETEIETTQLRFLVRREPNGEVSGYLHQLPVGAMVHVRGLNVEYEVPDDVDEVLFLAGGTGIAPAMQIAYWVLQQQQRRREAGGGGPKMRILWANRRREDALGAAGGGMVRDRGRRSWSLLFGSASSKEPPIQQDPPPSLDMQHEPSSSSIIRDLEALRKNGQQGNLAIEYFIDEENSYITPDLLKSYITANRLKAANSSTEVPLRRKLILISGPEGFIRYYAGPKKWIGGKEAQGPLGGILKGVDKGDGWEVWKL